MPEELLKSRRRRQAIARTVILALTVAFYVALIPVVVLFSGPVYRALECTFSECDDRGVTYDFILSKRGVLQIGSSIRLPNGEPIGRVIGFAASGDERYARVVGHVESTYEHLFEQPLRCEATANFNLMMDADLVVSTCPTIELDEQRVDSAPLFCGMVDHFERMGQELRHFVLENVRPGEGTSNVQLSGPCGADNLAATIELARIVGGE